MANSTDTEGQDITSTTQFHEPINSRTRRMNIADNGKVINAANGDVRVDNQNIASAAEVVHMDDHSTRVASTCAKNDARSVVNLNFERFSPYDRMSRSIPNDPAAAFVDLRLPSAGLPLTSNYQPTWNETYGNFSDPRELSLQRRNTFTRWHDVEVTGAMQSAQDALMKFCQRMKFQDSPSVKLSWALTKRDIRQAGSRARKHYKKENRLIDRMVDLIRDINGFLSSDDDLLFLGWLDWLPEDKFKFCLANPVKYILISVVEHYPFDHSTIEHLRNILSLFSKSTAYVQLCRERRPTVDMPAATVYIFTQTIELMSSLLDFSYMRSREKEGYSRHIQSSVDRLRQTLEDINRSAKVKRRGGGRVRRTGKDDGNSTLQLYTSFHNLLRGVPAMDEPRESAYYTRRMSQAANDSQQRSLDTYTSSDARESTPDDTMSLREVLDALSFRYSDNKEDINECLKYAEPSAYEKSQLATLTQEDAFQKWLKEDHQPTALVIHGNLDDDENSPIGYLAAQIGRKYAKRRGFIVLNWFCGLHSDDDVTSILARLTGQLLSQAKPLLPSDINFVSRNEYKKLKQRDFGTLSRIFCNNIQELGSKRIVIFCLLDSISAYETGNSEKDCEKLVKFFRDLLKTMHRRMQNDQKHRMIFKLLLSEEQSSEVAAQYFAQREILEMDGEVDTEVDSDASVVDSD